MKFLSIIVVICYCFYIVDSQIEWRGTNFDFTVNNACHTVYDWVSIALNTKNSTLFYQNSDVIPKIFCWDGCQNYPSSNVFDGIWICRSGKWTPTEIIIQGPISIISDTLYLTQPLTVNSTVVFINSTLHIGNNINTSSVIILSSRCFASKNITFKLDTTTTENISPIQFQSNECGTNDLNMTTVTSSNYCLNYSSDISFNQQNNTYNSNIFTIKIFEVNNICNSDSENNIWIWILLSSIGLAAFIFAIVVISVKKFRKVILPFADRKKFNTKLNLASRLRQPGDTYKTFPRDFERETSQIKKSFNDEEYVK